MAHASPRTGSEERLDAEQSVATSPEEVRALVDQNGAPEGMRALHTLVQALQLGRRGRLPEPTMQVLVAIAKEELEQLTAKSERSETSQDAKDAALREQKKLQEAVSAEPPRPGVQGTPLASSDSEKTEKAAQTVTDLRYYFKHQYLQGGVFHHDEYEDDGDWTWRHKATGIKVWRDAIDLTSGHGGDVYFHYTSELAFQNITHAGKAVAEVWASLTTEGPHANAWWGKGVYSVPLQPHDWHDREELLDNNFRNMMKRDREDPEKGPAYVDREYPRRAAYCLPIIIYPPDAYDVSKRATPEMVAAGKPPGTNLADRLLNEPEKPKRCCVVLRVSGEDGVSHARGRLLDALHARADHAQGPARAEAKYRLGEVLWLRGLYEEALSVAMDQTAYAQHDRMTFKALNLVGLILDSMGRSAEAEVIHRQCLQGREAVLGREDHDTLCSMNNLAGSLWRMDRVEEAVELQRTVVEIRKRLQGPEHAETLTSMSNLSVSLGDTGAFEEALEMQQEVLEIRTRVLGPEHPNTLTSMNNLAFSLYRTEKFAEAAELLGRCLEAMERVLGADHPRTARARQFLEKVRSCL